MRRFLFLAGLTIVLLGGLCVGGGAALAAGAPFHPGELLFPLQSFAEQLQASWTEAGEPRAQAFMKLLERRIGDLADSAGGKREIAALEQLDLALDREAGAAADLAGNDPGAGTASDASDAVLRVRQLFLGNVEKAVPLMGQLSVAPVEAPELYQRVKVKLETLHAMLIDETVGVANLDLVTALPLVQGGGGATAAGTPAAGSFVVQFPPGSHGAVHAFYPLQGRHMEIQCQACHTTGQYAGTDPACLACHADKTPPNHYPGNCADCHVALGWPVIVYQHPELAALDCAPCHARNKPANHYSGRCGACHSREAWKPANFDHQVAGATDCQTCHARPAGHYNGQCSACHATSGWKPASFDHQVAGATDCQTCHARPAGHYGGQCSACHATSGWKPASFDHQVAGATDCQTCHARPAGHYGGQCSQCHATNGWLPASFDHQAAGATDCQSCHARPAGHYGGQCSQCHSTNGWLPASFDHSGQTNCSGCHTPPANHFSGQCSQCHSTNSWQGATFEHSFPLNHGNANGNCSSCHPSGGSAYNCYLCHNEQEMIKHHAEKGITDLSNCLSCHPGGRKD